MKKQIYKICRDITKEEILQRKDVVTESKLKTTSYLQRLENAPAASSVQYAGLRYRG